MPGRFSVSTSFGAIDRVTRPVRRMGSSLRRFARSASRGIERLNRRVDRLVGGLKRGVFAAGKMAAIGLGAVGGAAALLLKQFSKIEDAEAAFTPLLGGAKKAKDMVEAINKTAASTPFQFENLASSVSQLLPVMDGDIKNTIKTVRMLGDTAGGNAQKLDSITRGFTKAMLKGKVDMESLNMIAEAGVPIFGDLASVMGTKVNAAFFKMISAGKVTTTQLNRAFEKMTTKGGKFYKGMEISSRTLSGIISTLKDNIGLMAAEMGAILAPTVKNFANRAIKAVQVLKTWVEANKEVINTRFIQFLNIIKQFFIFLQKNWKIILVVIGAITTLIVTLKALAVVMGIINVLMNLNPVGIVITAIVALIAVVATLLIFWDKLKAKFHSLPASMKLLTVALFVLGGPLIWLAGLIVVVIKKWDKLKAFFLRFWGVVGPVFDKALNLIMNLFNRLPAPVKAFVAGPIGLFIKMAKMITDNWGTLEPFFENLWNGLVDGFELTFKIISKILDKTEALINSIDKISEFGAGKIKGIASNIKGVFNFVRGDGEEDQSATRQMISPQERMSRSIEESREYSSSEITLKSEAGTKAEVTKGKLSAGVTLQPTGGL